MEGVSLVSLNIERSKHLSRVESFLRSQNADVVSLQELMDYDIPLFERILGTECYFSPGTKHPGDDRPGILGIGMFSKLPIRRREQYYYVGNQSDLKNFDMTSAASKHETESHSVVRFDVEADSIYRICSTHFTWTPDGLPDDFQREDLKVLLKILEDIREFAICGDFNAPRGGEIFSALASRYKDNIPTEYVTSLDVNLHRAKKQGKVHEIEQKMVDGLFTTSEYAASDVQLVYGISDHAAIVGRLSKNL